MNILDTINTQLINLQLLANNNLGFDTSNIGASADGFEFNAASISTTVLIVLAVGALITAGIVGLKAFERAGDLAGDERRRAAGKEALPYLLVSGGVIFAAFVMFFMIQGFVGL